MSELSELSELNELSESSESSERKIDTTETTAKKTNASIRRVIRRIATTAAVLLCALAPAFGARARGEPVFAMRPGWRLVQAPVVSGDWAVAVAADVRTPPDLPASALLIARRTGDEWRTVDAASPAQFNAALDALPIDLLSTEDRAWFRRDETVNARARRSSVAGHRLPVPGGWTARMTQGPFGTFSHDTYWAIDLVLPTWGAYTSTVVATKAGVVMYVKDVSDVGGLGTGFSGYSNGVVIRHGPREYSWYWHLAYGSVPADVQPGAAIDAGAAIGRMGSTGYSSGAHLHFHVAESFAWAGCSPESGCPSREMRPNKAPWSRDIVPVDFEEVADEAAWTGCDSVAGCGPLPASANRLDAVDGAVAYWAREYDGPGWKMRAPYAGDLPGWLAGRARSLALPAGWRATLYDQPGLQGASSELSASRLLLDASLWSARVVRVDETMPTPTPTPAAPTPTPTQEPTSTPTATPVPLPSPTPSMGRRVTKALRSDLARAWPYLLGGEHVAGVEVDGRLTLPGECGWMVQSLSPGTHALTFTLRGDAPVTATVTAQRWPFVAPACVSVPADPGPLPLEVPCLDASDLYEPNGAALLAVPLTAGVLQQHRAALAGDVDWMSFMATAGAQYVVTTEALGAASDTVLELVDADGEVVLAYSDDAAGTGYASQIRWHAESSGRRYLRVRQWDPGAFGCGTNYALRMIEMVPRVWAAVMQHGAADR